MRKLIKIFRDKKYWTKNASCRLQDGTPIDLLYVDRQNGQQVGKLYSWSLQGAVAFHYNFETEPERRYRVMDKLSRAIKIYTKKDIFVADYNDHPDTTFSDIEKILKIADQLK